MRKLLNLINIKKKKVKLKNRLMISSSKLKMLVRQLQIDYCKNIIKEI